MRSVSPVRHHRPGSTAGSGSTPPHQVRAVAGALLALLGCGMAEAQAPPPAPSASRPVSAGRQSPASQVSGSPRLEVSSREWDFGQVWQGEPLSHEFTLANVGDAPLEFIQVRTSCGCTTPSNPKSPLQPGETDKMTVKYDSKRKARRTNQTVTLLTNDPTQPEAVLHVVGEVLPLYEIKPTDDLVFGQVLRSSAEKRTVEITNKYTDRLSLKLKEGQELTSCSVEVNELEPGTRFSVTATTQPPLTVGRVQQHVKLTTGFARVPEIDLIVYWFVQPPVEVSPQKLFLPTDSPDEMLKELRVTYTPDQPVEITSVKPSHDAIRVAVRPAPADRGRPNLRQYIIAVTLPPASRLPTGAEPQIEIVTTSPDPQYQRFVVPIVLLAPRARPGLPPAETQPAGQPAPGIERRPQLQPLPGSRLDPRSDEPATQ